MVKVCLESPNRKRKPKVTVGKKQKGQENCYILNRKVETMMVLLQVNKKISGHLVRLSAVVSPRGGSSFLKERGLKYFPYLGLNAQPKFLRKMKLQVPAMKLIFTKPLNVLANKENR